MRKLLNGIAYALLLIVAAFGWVVILIWMLAQEAWIAVSRRVRTRREHSGA